MDGDNVLRDSSACTGGAGHLRIDGSKTGFGLNTTTYSSVSRRVIPAQLKMTLSTFVLSKVERQKARDSETNATLGERDE